MEIWKDVPRYEGYYQVSNLGRVKSLCRIVNHSKGHAVRKECILNGTINNKGYTKVRLQICNVYKVFAVHQLVAMAFLDHIPNGMSSVVDHIDNNKLNNSLSNIQIVSNSENVRKNHIDRLQPRCIKTGRFTALP